MDVKNFRSLQAPDTVQVGEKVSVTVKTVLSDNCWKPHREEIDHDGSIVTITAYDKEHFWNGRANTLCLLAIHEAWRILLFEFETTGEATIRLRGRKINSEGEVEPRVYVHEHSLVVVE